METIDYTNIPEFEPSDDEKGQGMLIKNACRCKICGGSADRYTWAFQCRNNMRHMADLNTGIFADFSWGEEFAN